MRYLDGVRASGREEIIWRYTRDLDGVRARLDARDACRHCIPSILRGVPASSLVSSCYKAQMNVSGPPARCNGMPSSRQAGSKGSDARLTLVSQLSFCKSKTLSPCATVVLAHLGLALTQKHVSQVSSLTIHAQYPTLICPVPRIGNIETQWHSQES